MMPRVKCLLVAAILLISSSNFLQHAGAWITDPSEVGALKIIKNSLVDPLKKLNSWNNGDPCVSNWTGIFCTAVANDGYLHIQEIQLIRSNLSGSLMPQLGLLSHLKIVDFMRNNMSGSIPKEIGNVTSLELFQLDNNNFGGSGIPASYGNMTTLHKLSLRNCSLQGAIPDLSGIPRLSYLDLSWNQLKGSIPANKLSANITTIDISSNFLDGLIPSNFTGLPWLQRLSLQNNFLTGSVPSIWENMTFNWNDTLILDFQNNSLTNISNALNPSANVSILLYGNPICKNANQPDMVKFCQSQIINPASGSTTSSKIICSPCPTDLNYEYNPLSPIPCLCAVPLGVGLRLKSPAISDFRPYIDDFEIDVTSLLNLYRYQLYFSLYIWEKGPRLTMYLKLFPSNCSLFEVSEVLRLQHKFTGWEITLSDTFGPYELLNFTLGSYANVIPMDTASRLSKGALAGILLGSVAAALILSALVTCLIMRKFSKHRALTIKRSMSKISIKVNGVKGFTLEEMTLATNNFCNTMEVGHGGYGKVYKGILADGTLVAIKRAYVGSLQGSKQFSTEIELLSRLHHRNLVSLVGYCDDDDEQMLVYEFMQNGTLRDHLSAKSKEPLSFSMRLRIALETSRGILYLHTEADPPIFHRDIKASNILLDSRFVAKVADFGISRLAPVENIEGIVPGHVSTVVKGTPGYLDPEYFLTHKLTDKSDVYSLGVVFLELLTGMQPIWRGLNIVREANKACRSGQLFSIIDSSMGAYPSECIQKFASLALRCCQDQTDARPSMPEVVKQLERIWKMMPETDSTPSESMETEPAITAIESSSSSLIASYHFMSSNASSSDHPSSFPYITPR